MQLTDYLAVLRRNWLLIVACTVIGGALGTIAAVLTPMSYQASTSMYVAVRNTGAASDLALSTNYARQAVTSFVQVVPTAVVLDPVISELDLDTSPRQLAEQVKASSPLNTQTITITVTDPDPTHAAQLANAIAQSFATVVATELERPTGGETVGKVRVEVTSPARVPTAPSAPNVPLNITLGVLLGLALGVGVAVLRTVLDTRVHTAEDVEESLDAPILGAIPFDADAAKRPLIVQAAPHEPGSEAFRRVRTNLQFLDLDPGAPVFVVTSAAPAEGKSTTTANIALALAETGARVAMVDGDLRKPRLADNFHIEGGVGLSDVLAGRVELTDALQRWGSGKLFLLPAGTVPPNPAELLGSRAMATVLAELRSVFDFVLVDAPPLLAVTDAAVLARQATGAIFVAASGSTRKPQLENAVKSLAAVDARVLGAILTKVPTKGPDSAGYHAYTYAATHAGGR